MCIRDSRNGIGVGGQDLSHETLGTETIESHLEPGVGLNKNDNELHEPTVRWNSADQR